MVSGLSFSKNGKYLALAERRDCKDYVSVFTTSSWQLLKVGNVSIVVERATLMRMYASLSPNSVDHHEELI